MPYFYSSLLINPKLKIQQHPLGHPAMYKISVNPGRHEQSRQSVKKAKIKSYSRLSNFVLDFSTFALGHPVISDINPGRHEQICQSSQQAKIKILQPAKQFCFRLQYVVVGRSQSRFFMRLLFRSHGALWAKIAQNLKNPSPTVNVIDF